MRRRKEAKELQNLFRMERYNMPHALSIIHNLVGQRAAYQFNGVSKCVAVSLIQFDPAGTTRKQ